MCVSVPPRGTCLDAAVVFAGLRGGDSHALKSEAVRQIRVSSDQRKNLPRIRRASAGTMHPLERERPVTIAIGEIEKCEMVRLKPDFLRREQIGHLAYGAERFDHVGADVIDGGFPRDREINLIERQYLFVCLKRDYKGRKWVIHAGGFLPFLRTLVNAYSSREKKRIFPA